VRQVEERNNQIRATHPALSWETDAPTRRLALSVCATIAGFGRMPDGIAAAGLDIFASVSRTECFHLGGILRGLQCASVEI